MRDEITRLRNSGPQALNNQELLTIITGRTGPALRADDLRRLAEDRRAPVRLQAALELGRRVYAAALPKRASARDEPALARALIDRYGHHAQEHLGVVLVDTRQRIIQTVDVYVGTVNAALVSTRDIFRHALSYHAAGIIVFHNHPSGDTNPSAEDLSYTRKLRDAGRSLDVDVIDHLIIGPQTHYSLRDHHQL